jgi:aerobic carbon-monoxide dehydrogenase small subunit
MTVTSLTLNGRAVTADIAPRTHLAEFIREDHGLTGTHLGCEHGICGACTVEIDGQIARSCITLAVTCDGAAIRTIEDFDSDTHMVRLRQAFQEEHALQCGYCTPGMLIAARDLIRRRAAKTEREIRAAMSGNLCRCTGYAGIIAAIVRVTNEEFARQSEPLAAAGSLLGPVGSFAEPRPEFPDSTPPSSGARVRTPALPIQTEEGRPVEVRTGAPEERDGQTVLTQSFVLPHPATKVWNRFADLDVLVSCLPGAELETPQTPDGKFEGSITLSLGPIRPSFRGRGQFTASSPTRTGEIIGEGSEKRGTSRASGRMFFRAEPESVDGTRVSIEMSYKLTGPLAQFARPTLVAGIISETGTIFANNLNNILSGHRSLAGPHALGLRFVLRALWQGLLRKFQRQR